MATNYFKAIHHHHHHHHHHSLWRRCAPIPTPTPTPTPTPCSSSFFLKVKNTQPLKTSSNSSNKTTSLIIPFSTASSSTNATSPSTSKNVSFDLLHQHLSSQNFRQADEETRRLLILLAGEQAQKRGYVFFSELQFISVDDLRAIDQLWRKYSDGRFGYSVQKRIWNKAGRDFTKLFVDIGWMKKLETEVLQYGYRAFPEEFIWEINEETQTPPQGHLPLTNALRGTQLFTSILTHPAFGGGGGDDDEDDGGDDKNNDVAGGGKGKDNNGGSEPLTNKVFKPDYTF